MSGVMEGRMEDGQQGSRSSALAPSSVARATTLTR